MKKGYYKIGNITIFAIFMIILWVGLGFIINFCFFHADPVPATEGHYEERVYITPYGACYHTENCSYIDRKWAISIASAKERGYTACKHCKGKTFQFWIDGTPAQLEKNNYLFSFGISTILVFSISFFTFLRL